MLYMDDALKLVLQGAEITAASTLTVLHRGVLAASYPPGGKTWIEGQRMFNEKIIVSFQVGNQIQKSILQYSAGDINPFRAWQQMIAPVRKTALANARRLSGPG